MADFGAIAAALKSIERLLNAAFQDEQPVLGKKTHAVLVRTSDFTEALGSRSSGCKCVVNLATRKTSDTIERCVSDPPKGSAFVTEL